MLLLSLAISAALSGQKFEPSEPWAVGVAEGRCLIHRPYVSGSLQGTLEFGLSPLGSAFVRTVLPKSVDSGGGAEKAALLLNLGGVESTLTQSPTQSGMSEDGRQIRTLHGLKRADLDRLHGAPEILVTFGSREPIRFTSNNAEPALTALDECVAKQVTEWGINLQTEASIKDGAVATNYGMWIEFADYPPAAKQQELEGVVQVIYFVEPDGRVRDCKTMVSSGHELLDAATCNAIKSRARFKPARNSEGRAVRQMGSRRVVWSLPR